MTGSLNTLFVSLDKIVHDLAQERRAARAQVAVLERENRLLHERLTTLECRLSEVVSHVKALAVLDVAQDAPLGQAPQDAGAALLDTERVDTTSQKPMPAPLSDDARPSAAAVDGAQLPRQSAPETAAPDALAHRQSVQETPSEGVPLRHEESAAMSASLTEAPGQRGASAPSPQQLLKQWYARYPQVFFKAHTRPLQIGIHEALIAKEPWSSRLVRRTLACYVNLPRYMKSLRPGAARIDLQGQPAGQVTEEEAHHAREQLIQLQLRQKERDQAQQQRRLSSKLEALQRQHRH